MLGILLHLLSPITASLLYAALGFHFWRTRWQEHGPSAQPLTMQTWERVTILGALALQALNLYANLFGEGGMRFSFSLALS